VLRSDTAAYRQQAVGSAGTFLGRSPAAQRVSSLVQRIGRSDATVLLRGETGTGKSFVARLIHEASPRAQEPFRVINCASIPESLFESELFGHERGAFTGAVATRPGAFEAAGEGTVFLDEIGEMPLASQAKLLRVLEERRFERLGSNRSLPLGARVIAASNRDLHAMVKAGTFRADLLFRISVVHIDVPPLRERGDDVLLLARQILADLAPSGSRRVLDFAPCALDAIRAHRWPGNVRELRNAIESAVVLGEGPLVRAEDLALAPPSNAGGDPAVVKLPASLADLEVRAIEAAMRACKGNRTRAAAILGINRVTLYKKLKGSQLDGEGDES
jgi:DNA-binding NtrC family response regulator